MSASLESEFGAALSNIGYTGQIGKLPPEAMKNERLVRFLKWVTGLCQPSNLVSSHEIKSFEELKCAGKVLQGQQLHQALSELGPTVADKAHPQSIRREISSLNKAIVPLKSQLQNLSTVQKMLSEHQSVLLCTYDQLNQQLLKLQKQKQTAVEKANDDNIKMNKALEQLKSSVEEVCAFHRQDKGVASTVPVPSPFLSLQSLDQYNAAEDCYLKELTNYTKKQFFNGIASMAHQPEDEEMGVVELEGDGGMLLKGISEEAFQQYSKELARLKALYPLSEIQRINNLVAERHVQAACQRAEEELGKLKQMQQMDQLDPSLLRQQVKVKQARVNELRSRIEELGGSVLPELLQEMATLQFTKVLHGDCDLKIARQNYFTSKQDKVITHLQAQRARHEVLSMLYELELRRHRETHRLLSAAKAQLVQWKDTREQRCTLMRNPALFPQQATKQTIDSKDSFLLKLCSMLGVEPASGPVPMLTYSGLQSSAEELAKKISSLEGTKASLFAEQRQIAGDIEGAALQLQKLVYGHCGGYVDQPQLTSKAFDDESSKLRTIMDSLEHNVKSLLKDYANKKKVIDSSPLLQKEREIFIHFFTNPPALAQMMAELARKVDAMATAAARKTL